MTRYAGADTSQGTPIGGGGNPTIAIDATLSQPTSLALDKAGNLYVAEYGSAHAYTRSLPTAASPPTPVRAGREPWATAGWPASPTLNVLGIATDASNNLLIADGVSNACASSPPPTGSSIRWRGTA